MNYMEKINNLAVVGDVDKIRGKYNTDKSYICRCNISVYIKNISREYFKFMNFMDGFNLPLAGIRFLGFSDNSYIETIESVIRDYDEIYSEIGEESPFRVGSGRLPIALDSGGNVIYLSNSGEVWIFYNDGGDHEFIANSFEEFMDHIIFGDGYREYYNLSDEECEEDEWYQYLKLKGWVKD